MSSKINFPNHYIPDVIDGQTCPHLARFRALHGSKPFRALQDCLSVKPLGGRAAILRDSTDVPRCATCGDSSRTRLYACLACAVIACHSPPLPSHAAAHADTIPEGHEIAVDVDRAELFCCACRDQVYDRDFDAAVVLAQTSAMTTVAPRTTVACESSLENLNKRRRVDFRPWCPDSRERNLVWSCSSTLHNDTLQKDISKSELPWGLRGLNNMGNTCFMNSVLQALLHTPPLRNYFLSDRHNKNYCQQKNGLACGGKRNSGGRGARGDAAKAEVCLACDLDGMFSAFFSGDRKPYSPAKFLYSWWQHAANLASYEQQDAHEFFISMLDGIHEKVERDKRKILNPGNGDCCIAHRVFSGILRSDVMCMACGFTSTTYDPCVDISLDLEPLQGGSAKASSAKSRKAGTGVVGAMKSSQNVETSTLLGCLDRFTRPERLGSDQKFFCQRCKVQQESLKQMSIRKLPLVFCFHIKRFEHSSVRKMSRKVDRYLQFSFSIDMAPYLSSSILRSRFGNRIFPLDSEEPDASDEMSSEFELFAVVSHTGKLDAGHYVTYLRLSNQWYKCDDAWISEVNENSVRAAQGYMMFYVQKMLYYKASEKVAASVVTNTTKVEEVG